MAHSDSVGDLSKHGMDSHRGSRCDLAALEAAAQLEEQIKITNLQPYVTPLKELCVRCG